MRHLTPEEDEALVLLARNRKLFVVVIPDGVPDVLVIELKRSVDEMLEELVIARDRLAGGPVQ